MSVSHLQHLFEQVSVEDSTMSCPRQRMTSSSRVMTRSRLSSEKKSDPCPAIAEDVCISPMRPSKSRYTYHTTDAKGELVEVRDAYKQWGSITVLREQEKSEEKRATEQKLEDEKKRYETCPIIIPTTSEPYEQLSMFEKTRDSRSLSGLFYTMINCHSDSKLCEDVLCLYLVTKVTSQKANPQFVFYKPIPDEYAELKECTKLTFLHAYSPLDWARIKAVVIEIALFYGIESLLNPKSISGDAFEEIDNLICSGIMCMIHFPIFKKRSDEVFFWRSLFKVNKKTQYLIDFLDKFSAQYVSHLRFGSNTACRAIVEHSLPHVKVFRETPLRSLHKKVGLIVKWYMYSPVSKSEWVSQKHQSARRSQKNEEHLIQNLKLSISQMKESMELFACDDCSDVSEQEQMYNEAVALLKRLKADYFVDGMDYHH